MHKELPAKPRHKKRAWKWWEQGQVTQEEYTDTAQAGRGGMRKSKAHVEFNNVRDGKSNKNIILK